VLIFNHYPRSTWHDRRAWLTFCLSTGERLGALVVPCKRTRTARLRGRRGTTALEFAILAIPYFLLVLGVCEVGFDMFLQEATDLALEEATRSIEIGISQGTATESSFVQSYVCNTTAGSLLICKNFHIKVQTIALTNGPNGVSATDFSNAPSANGSLPMSGHNLDLSGYDGATSFCNAPAGSLILVSAVYVGPTFLSGLMPYVFNETYNGNPVHAVLSQVGIASENFTSTKSGGASSC
jgi:Flp pilus assembly protein TadG